MSATDTICASAGLRIFPSVGITAIPSPMIFCENTGSGTSSNGTALPVSGDSINTFLPSSLFINCSLPDILLRPAFLLCPVSCFLQDCATVCIKYNKFALLFQVYFLYFPGFLFFAQFILLCFVQFSSCFINSRGVSFFLQYFMQFLH